MQTIEFGVNNHKIIGAITFPLQLKKLNPAILFIHGWTSGQNRFFTYMDDLSKLGYICMSFDMEGHGKSEGNLEMLRRSDFLSDTIAAWDYLSKLKGIDKQHINIVGSSFGSYLGAILSSKRTIDRLVLRAPADYSNDGFNEVQLNQNHTAWRTVPHTKVESYALEAINKFQGQVLIVESEKDQEIHQQTIKNYIDSVSNKAKLKHFIMKGAPHSINHTEKFINEFREILINFFK